MTLLIHPRALAIVLSFALATLAGCGSPQQAAADAGDAGAASPFIPAPWPPKDICTFLASADVRTIFPTAHDCQGDDPLSPDGPDSPFWIVGGHWRGDTGDTRDVYLTLTGALTPKGASDLVPSVPFYVDGGAVLEPVSGIGSQAGYLDAPGLQSLQARSGNYLLELRADNFTEDVPEALLAPLVGKAIAEL